MKRLHVIGLALVAVFAFSAVMASAASARYNWWVNNAKLANATPVKLTAKTTAGSSWIFETTVEGVKVKITCTTFNLTGGEIENTHNAETGVDRGTVEFPAANCTVNEPGGCTLAKNVVLLGKNTELVENTGKTEPYDLYLPNASGQFTEFELTGAFCIAKGKFIVEGNGVADEFPTASTSQVKQQNRFPGANCNTGAMIEKVIDWEGKERTLKLEVTFNLKKFAATFCGSADLELESKEPFDIKL